MATTIKQAQGPAAASPLQVVDIPIPPIQPGHVSIRVRAAAANPIDWKRRDLGFMVRDWPATFGEDVSGTIEAVAPDVTAVQPGEDVLAYALQRGFSSVIVVPVSHVARKPASLSFEDAASLPLGYLTALAGVHTGLGLAVPFVEGTDGSAQKQKQQQQQPRAVLVLGGSSSVGASAIQILRLVLPQETKILTTSSAAHEARLKKLGADVVLDRNATSLVEDIRAATPEGKGVDAILDTVGAAAQTELFETLREDGLRVLGEIATGAQINEPENVKRTTVYATQLFGRAGGSNVYSALEKLLAKGEFQVPIDVKVVGESLDDASAALDALKAGVSGSKLVIRV